MLKWYVGYTQVNGEFKAKENLIKQDFEVYLPLCEKMRSHARKIERVQKPLFPRYLFIRMDIQKTPWGVVNSTRGMSCLLTREGYPLAVADDVLAYFKHEEDDQANIPLSSLVAFQKGDKLKIKEGAFKGQEGEFEQLTDQERVCVLLDILDKKVKIPVPIQHVEKLWSEK